MPFGPQVHMVALSINTAFGERSSFSRPYAPSGKYNFESLASSFSLTTFLPLVVRFALKEYSFEPSK